jgi:uncharacterized protein YeaO (DUF488 family)
MATIRSASGTSAAVTRRNWQTLNVLAHLRELASGRGVTLLTATRQPEISEAAILARLLRDWPSAG